MSDEEYQLAQGVRFLKSPSGVCRIVEIVSWIAVAFINHESNHLQLFSNFIFRSFSQLVWCAHWWPPCTLRVQRWLSTTLSPDAASSTPVSQSSSDWLASIPASGMPARLSSSNSCALDLEYWQCPVPAGLPNLEVAEMASWSLPQPWVMWPAWLTSLICSSCANLSGVIGGGKSKWSSIENLQPLGSTFKK